MRNALAVLGRAVVQRRSLSIGCVAVAVIAFVAAAVGPAYVASSQESLFYSRMSEAPVATTGLSWSQPLVPGGNADAAPTPALATDAARRVDAAVKGPDFGAARPRIITKRTISDIGRPDLLSWRLEWRPDQCRHLVLTGRCPTRPGEALVAAVDVDRGGFEIGSRLPLQSPRHRTFRPVVVGSYRLRDPGGGYWYDPTRYASTPPQPTRTGRSPYQPAPFFVQPEDIGSSPAARTIGVDKALLLAPGLAADLPQIVRFVSSARFANGVPGRDGTLTPDRSGLPDLAASIRAERSRAAGTVVPATLALIAVCLVLLYRLFGAAADARRPELALAKLRGWRLWRIWVLGLGEPALLIVVGAVAGVFLSVPADALLVRLWLRPGTGYGPGPGAVRIVLGVLVVTVLAAALATWHVLREPVHDQLETTPRPVPPGRVEQVAKALVVALAAATVATLLLRKQPRAPGLLDQGSPVLLGLAVALLTTVVAGRLARRLVDRTADSRRLAGFLGARALARRREGVLLVLPITMALTLSVFVGATWLTSRSWRESEAAYEVGAPQSFDTKINVVQAESLTRRIDPQGRWLMATGQMRESYPQSMFVDTIRLRRVAAWPDQWLGPMSVDHLVQLLRPAYPSPAIRGGKVRLTARFDGAGRAGVFVTLSAIDVDGSVRAVSLGPFGATEQTLEGDLAGCTRGCRLTTLTLGGTSGVPTSVHGTAHLVRLVAAGQVVDARFSQGDRGWHAALPIAPNANRATPRVLPAAKDGLVVSLDTGDQTGFFVLQSSASPAAVPVVTGRASRYLLAPGNRPGVLEVAGLSDPLVRGRRVAVSEALPLLGNAGALGDLDSAVAAGFDPTALLKVRIFARTGVPASMLTALGRGGVDVSSPTRLSDARRALDTDAYALSLRLYAVVAVLVMLLAAAGSAANVAVQLRARRLDAASLRLVGVRSAVLTRAALLEFAAIFALAAVAGVVAGIVAQQAVVRSMRLGVLDARSPRVVPDVEVAPLVVFVALVGLLLLGICVVCARAVVRGARASLLRDY